MRVLMLVSLVVSAIAAVDALRGGHWDQFVMLFAIEALTLALLALHARTVAGVRLRPDLLVWVREQASATDDEPELVVDRAVSAYRSGMLPASTREGGGG